MKAQVLYKQAPIETNPLVYEDVPLPSPENFDIRVRVSACGMCLTDKHIIEGDIGLKKLPIIPGHQIVGTVDALGAGVSLWKIGDRVGIPWLHGTCGHCYYCNHELENLCEKGTFTGCDSNGGYAEYAIAGEKYVVKIPDGVEDVNAAPLLCAGIVGYRSYKATNVIPGGRLGLFGFGGAAHLMLQVAHHFHCKVYVFTRSQNHQELAKKMGAVFVGSAKDRPKDLLDGAIIFAPSGELVPHALRYVRPGGTVVFNAIHASPIPEMDYSLIYKERTLKSVSNATRGDAEEFMALAQYVKAEGKIYPLERANDALLDLKHSRINGSGVFIP